MHIFAVNERHEHNRRVNEGNNAKLEAAKFKIQTSYSKDVLVLCQHLWRMMRYMECVSHFWCLLP